MKIRLKVQISGTRNGQDWPRIGGVVDLPDEEAISYIASGMADPVATFSAPETTTLPEQPELRAPTESGGSAPLTEENAGMLVPAGRIVHRRGK